MAKMFYNMEETKQKLGLAKEQIDQLVRSGKLRDFHDGAKIMFKVDEVDNFDLSALTGADEEAQLTPPSLDGIDDPLGLSTKDTGSSIGLTPMDTGSVIGLVPGDSADQISLDDTSQGQDNNDDTVITTHGTKAFDVSSSGSGPALNEPFGQAQLTSDDLMGDQISLDSGSSGSGLLDLSREADDTSLGAELLEEIYPTVDEGAVETQLPTQLDIAAEPEPAEPVEPQPPEFAEFPMAVQYYDPTSGVFGAMMIVPFVVLLLAFIVTAAGLADVQPAFLTSLGNGIWYIMGGAAGLALMIVLIGSFIVSQNTQPRGAPKAKKIKTKKPKPAKAGAK